MIGKGDSTTIWENFLGAKRSVLVLITPQYKGYLNVIALANKFDDSFINLSLSVKMLQAVLMIHSLTALGEMMGQILISAQASNTFELLKSVISLREIV